MPNNKPIDRGLADMVGMEYYNSLPPKADEPTLEVTCECGRVYSLHAHTVCPRCFAWPKDATAK